MKIAAVSDDETNISQHFGRGAYYVVLTVEDGQIVDKEIRPKTGHHIFAAHEPPKLAPGERHGFDAGSQVRHASMAETIADCQVVLAGGMGWGAYESLKGLGAEVIVTDVENIHEAADMYLKGKLLNQMERLH